MPNICNLEKVLSKFPASILERYNFSNAKYTGALEPITGIVCHKHGVFSQYSAQLRKNGAGCQACGGEVRASKRRSPFEDVLKRAAGRHNNYYTYDRAVYVNSATKFAVTCPLHGDFRVTPNNHITHGRGCPTCGAAKRGIRSDVLGSARKTANAKIAKFADKFVTQAHAVHGDAYDYGTVEYQGRNTKVKIICPHHGPFAQKPYQHVARSQGCPECSHHRSKGEAAILRFVSTLVEAKSRDRSVIPPKELDIYIPSASLAIEYCGEYWHSSASVEEERRDKLRHINKYLACRAQGIRLLTIYESEWETRSPALKRLIRNALGKGRGRLMARKCDLRSVPRAEACRFFEAYHPQGSGGYGEHYGLYHNHKLVACMRFTFGINDRGANTDRTWTLSRYATRITVAGGASRLFKAFLKKHDPDTVKSFSDNRYFMGGMYAALGFELEEDGAPDYQVYHPKLGLLPKTAWQRRKIPAQIKALGVDEVFDPATDPRSERDMTYLLGARRLFDCGKKRWVWKRIAKT